MVWHKDNELPKSDLVVIPGGFSYGDYLRSGAIAAKSILHEVISKKRVVLFWVYVTVSDFNCAGLLQGALLRNQNLKFLSKDVFKGC